MPDFDPLDDVQAQRVRRWLLHRKLFFAARVMLAQAAVRAALARTLDTRLDPQHPATPTDRARLLAMRSQPIKSGNRAIAGGRLAFVRLVAILNLRRES